MTGDDQHQESTGPAGAAAVRSYQASAISSQLEAALELISATCKERCEGDKVAPGDGLFGFRLNKFYDSGLEIINAPDYLDTFSLNARGKNWL